MEHLQELRHRFILSLISFTLIFVACFVYSSSIYAYFAQPMMQQIGNHALIATNLTATFLVPLKLTLIVAFLLNMPFTIYHCWAFITPALYKHEKNELLPNIILSCLLFFSGISFGFKVICPMAIRFFYHYAPQGVTVMTDIANYLDFLFTTTISAGLAFQIPIVIKSIIKYEILSKQDLKQNRGYFAIIAFTLAMILTPPDVVSQILLALPMLALYELGLLISDNTKDSKKSTLPSN